MSEFIESSEQESPKGTVTRESSVFESPTYMISFNEDFTLQWEPAIGSMELAVALCYQFPLEKSLEDKMRAATKLFLKQNKKKEGATPANVETVVSNPVAPAQEDSSPACSTTAIPLPAKSEVAVDNLGEKFGMKIMKWNPELQGFSQKRSRRKLREDEAVQVAANRGYACEDHKRRKLKCNPNQCLQNGQNVASRTSMLAKSKIHKASLPPHNKVASEICDREQVILEQDFLLQNSQNPTYPNGQDTNVPFEPHNPILLDPMAPIFTPSSFPPTPFNLSPLSSATSSANLNLLDQGSNYGFDPSNPNISSNLDANSFVSSSYDSSYAAFDWQLPVQQCKIDLESFDFSVRTPDSSNDTSAPLDENDASWDTWFNHLYDPPKDNISLTPPESHYGTSISHGKTPEPYTTPPPYRQTRSVQRCRTSSQDSLNDGIGYRSELPSRSGPQERTRRLYSPASGLSANSISRGPQPPSPSDNRPVYRSVYSLCLERPTERASHYSNLASYSLRASEVPERQVSSQKLTYGPIPVPIQAPFRGQNSRYLDIYGTSPMLWRNASACGTSRSQNLMVTHCLPREEQEDILTGRFERMMV